MPSAIRATNSKAKNSSYLGKKLGKTEEGIACDQDRNENFSKIKE